jgi:ABC-type multidrug transport system fused ATPase/permease subunit
MFDKVMDLPAQWHKDHHSGDTIDKINKASESLHSFAFELFVLVENFVGVFGAIIIMSIFDWRATLIAVIVSVIAIGSIIRLDRFIRRNYRKIFKFENFLEAGVYDYISNIITVITLRLQTRASREMHRRAMQAFDTTVRNQKLIELKWFLASLYIILMTVTIIMINSYSTYKKTGVIIIGTLYILFRYLRNIGRAFYTFAWKYGEIVRQDTAVRAAEVINEEYKKLKFKDKHYLPAGWKILKIANLSFKYNGHETKNDKLGQINNLSLTIEKGKRIALIGESGSGKSTVFSLLRGLHYPQTAAVYLDGKKLDFGLANLYEIVTLIPQEPEIFNTTAKENITMGVKTTEKDIKLATRLARFDQVIKRLPKKLETNVMEKGVSLSGGEKQRLALARGLLAARDSEFLLLDEPTSNVDSDNEFKIYENIFKSFKNYTIIASVHRLHLLYNFDYIYYFKDGGVIAEGRFNAILNDEQFKTLWENYHKDKKDT